MTTLRPDDLTDTAPGSTPDDEPLARPRAKLLDLSLTQLLGGSMAAATAAALGSRLGVVGTIAGAAVLSIISAIAASLYTNSMARAREAVVLVRSRRGADGVQVDTVEISRPDVGSVRERWWRRTDRTTIRRTLATTGVVFAVAAAFLIGLQLATGAPVTGTDLGGRTSSGAGVDSPAAPGSGQSGSDQPGSTAETATPTPSATTPVTTPTPGASVDLQSTQSGQATAPAPATGSSTPTAPGSSGEPTSPAEPATPSTPTAPVTPDVGAPAPTGPVTAP